MSARKVLEGLVFLFEDVSAGIIPNVCVCVMATPQYFLPLSAILFVCSFVFLFTRFFTCWFVCCILPLGKCAGDLVPSAMSGGGAG